MKTCAIICEYNCLHNGHIRLINYAKSIADHCICIMSGNFTQRGMPAVADKYTRAKHAILAGADAVVEMPTIFATAVASSFAYSGVNIATRLGCDMLLFGSECGDIETLSQCAHLSNVNNLDIKLAMSSGISYPRAISTLLPEYSHILDEPNNTLAIEYIKAIEQLDSPIVPITITRHNNYNTNELTGQYSSASAIRHNINNPLISNYLPQYVIDDVDISIEQRYKDFASKYLSTCQLDLLEQIEGVSEGLHNKFFANATVGDYDQIIMSVKSKRYTQLRLQRIILCSILNITKSTMQHYINNELPITLLCIESKASNILLKYWKDLNSNIATTEGNEMSIDKLATRLYTSLSHKTMPHSLQKINR